MSRIAIPATVDAAPAASQPLLEAVRKQLGVVPNLFRLVGRNPAALEGYLGLFNALGKNLAKLDDAELAANRHGTSNDPKADAAVRFAVKVVRERGHVADRDLYVSAEAIR